LPWLQIARAQALAGKESQAKRSYETFLKLWKDADPDLPAYRQAKMEYARLLRTEAKNEPELTPANGNWSIFTSGVYRAANLGAAFPQEKTNFATPACAE
jgi:hypothetical protein